MTLPATDRRSSLSVASGAWTPDAGGESQLPKDEQLPSTEELPSLSKQKTIDWASPTDPENPFNWPVSKKWRVTLLACFMTFVVQINGTMMTSAAEQINESFHVSDEAFPHSYWPVLSWNLGGAAGPLLGLPLMENFGVRWTYLVGFVDMPQVRLQEIDRDQAIHTVLIIFIIPQAVAPNFATLIITRIFTGSCSAVLSNITSGFVRYETPKAYDLAFP